MKSMYVHIIGWICLFVNVQRAIRSWYNGADICTMPPKILEQMYDHILTDKGMEIFEKDWESVKK